MSAGHISVKNFARFQHYKDRNPTWIKLYNELLDDYEFGCLQDASKLHLVMIWLLASRHGNRIPNDREWIARRINATSPIDLEALENAGFISVVQDASNTLAGCKQDASNTLAGCKQDASPETETEKETENNPPVVPPTGDAKPKNARSTQLPDTWQPNDTHQRIATQQHVDLDREAEQFRDFHAAKGTTFKDWDAAFRTWLRNATRFGNGPRAPPQHRAKPIVDEQEYDPQPWQGFNR